jgi:hypothetical protein
MLRDLFAVVGTSGGFGGPFLPEEGVAGALGELWFEVEKVIKVEGMPCLPYALQMSERRSSRVLYRLTYAALGIK